MTKPALKIFSHRTDMYFQVKEKESSQNYLPGKLRIKWISFKAEV